MSNKLRNAFLMDPEYWRAFMERANQPISRGAPTWGSLVPGLGPYMATRNALNAYQQGDQDGAGTAATEAALWLAAPPARLAGPLLRSYRSWGARGRVRSIPLPVAPGLNSVGSTPADKLRPAKMERLRYNNPALTEEYWRLWHLADQLRRR